MGRTRLIPVHGYFDPAIFEVMEETRKTMRRITKSRFLEDAVVEKLERMGKYPPQPLAHDGHRRKKTAA